MYLNLIGMAAVDHDPRDELVRRVKSGRGLRVLVHYGLALEWRCYGQSFVMTYHSAGSTGVGRPLGRSISADAN